MRCEGLRRRSPSCRSYSKTTTKNHLSGLLNWCGRDWHTHTCQRSILSTARLRLRHRHRTWNGCPEGWTVQGGNCAPYKGPGGGGWNTWNGCSPGYTVQGGNCAPYQGPVGGGWRTGNGCPPGWTVQGGACKPYRYGPWDIYGGRQSDYGW